MCKYPQNAEVLYILDNDQEHVYIVRDSTEVSNAECAYHIMLKGDPGIQLVNVAESYMTDTVGRKGKITPEASASS